MIMNKTDLSVKIESWTNSSYLRPINIIETGNDIGNQYLKLKFGGADSGIYNLIVTSKSYGAFNCTGVTL